MAIQRFLHHSGFGVRFSPHLPRRRILVAGSDNLTENPNIPNGCLYVLDLDFVHNEIVHYNSFPSATGQYDCSWSKLDRDFAVSGADDGSLTIFNTSHHSFNNPIHTIASHPSRILSVDWSPHLPDILAASDGSVKLWRSDHVNGPDNLRTFPCAPYHSFGAVAWSPFHKDRFATACSNGTATVWDTRNGTPARILHHDGMVLSCDWSKFNDNLLATVADGCCVRTFDVRLDAIPLIENFYERSDNIRGKVCFGGHIGSVLFCSSDDLVDVWDHDVLAVSYGTGQYCVLGLDVCPRYDRRLLACSGANGTVAVWRHEDD